MEATMDRPATDEPLQARRWSVWTWLVWIPVMGISTAVLGSCAWLLAWVRHEWAFPCMRLWGRLLCALNFTPVEVEGLEHVQPGRAYVIMTNHQSYFDILAVCARWPAQFRWVIKQELRRVPFLGSATARMGCVFVDRRNREAAVASLRAAKPLFDRGISLLIFPEGTRRRDGRLGEFKKGGFMVALDSSLPVLPVSLSGAYRVLRPGTLALRPGRVRIRIHAPVDTAAYGLEGRDRLMADVRAAIAAGLAPHERGEGDA
jgi:1-acyl-sn-glycerol-3-phosphate acyltransferase